MELLRKSLINAYSRYNFLGLSSLVKLRNSYLTLVIIDFVFIIFHDFRHALLDLMILIEAQGAMLDESLNLAFGKPNSSSRDK